MGSYAAYVGDIDDVVTGIRVLSGVPVMKYSAVDTSVDNLWSYISQGYQQTSNPDITWRYIMAAIGSDGTQGDTNSCGLRN